MIVKSSSFKLNKLLSWILNETKDLKLKRDETLNCVSSLFLYHPATLTLFTSGFAKILHTRSTFRKGSS